MATYDHWDSRVYLTSPFTRDHHISERPTARFFLRTGFIRRIMRGIVRARDLMRSADSADGVLIPTAKFESPIVARSFPAIQNAVHPSILVNSQEGCIAVNPADQHLDLSSRGIRFSLLPEFDMAHQRERNVGGCRSCFVRAESAVRGMRFLILN